MKMLIEIDTQNVESLKEVQAFIEGQISFGTHSVTETAQKSTKEVTPDPEPSEDKKAVKKPSTKSSITLENLKDSAKNATQRVPREDVKKVINEFAVKISEVKEEDYGKLYKKLQTLGK